MAPKRKREESEASPSSAGRVTRSGERSTKRATRSATSRGDVVLLKPMDNPEPRKPKKPKTVIIEHSSERDLFRTKANQVRSRLNRDVRNMNREARINVVINPEEPRNGCFEIRREGGEIFVSLLDMVSPFQPLMDLSVSTVVADIIQRLFPRF